MFACSSNLTWPMTGQFLPSRYGRHLSFLHRPNPSYNLLLVEEHDSGEWSLSVQNKDAKKKMMRIFSYIRCFRRNPRFLWFSFTLPRDWSRKLTPLSQPIRFKAKTNRRLVTCVSRAWRCLCVFTLSAHWLLMNIAFHLIDRFDYIDIGLWHSIGKRSKRKNLLVRRFRGKRCQVIIHRLMANCFFLLPGYLPPNERFVSAFVTFIPKGLPLWRGCTK